MIKDDTWLGIPASSSTINHISLGVDAGLVGMDGV
jgi:hypothetical protein